MLIFATAMRPACPRKGSLAVVRLDGREGPSLVSIDGSMGEGGGQVLRAALALSAIMEADLKITNIRANRDPPGLKAQHAAAVRAVGELCSAQIEGAEVGSSELRFKPDVLRGGSYKFDVGTAGSVALVLQAALPAAIRSGERVEMKVIGGTEVPRAPTFDYFQRVLGPVVKGLGANVSIELGRRGFFPKGGGEVRVLVEPSGGIKPFAPEGNQPKPLVHGIIVNSGLPEGIIDRTRKSLLQAMRGVRLGKIDVDHVESPSQGISATVWCERRGGALGSSGVGSRGYSAEDLGRDTAMPLVHALQAGADVDGHLLDQVLLYCVMATGRSSFTFDRMTSHAQTLLDVAREFTNFRYEISRDGRRQRVVVDGEGL